MSKFSDRFNEICNSSGKNDAEIGDALGVSRQTINAWRNGTRSPKQPTIVTIAQYFGVSIPYLMCRTDIRTEIKPISADTLAPDETELLGLYRQLNAKGKQNLLDNARSATYNPDYREDTPSTAIS